jgi:hypothetical protein
MNRELKIAIADLQRAFNKTRLGDGQGAAVILDCTRLLRTWRATLKNSNCHRMPSTQAIKEGPFDATT